MPKVINEITGEVVAEEDYTPGGVERAIDRAAQSPILKVEQSPNLEADYSPGGTYDGAMRSVTEYAGGGKTGYNKIGMYKEGGQVGKNLKVQVKQVGGEVVEEVPIEEEI